jgi:hypothetical protein
LYSPINNTERTKKNKNILLKQNITNLTIISEKKVKFKGNEELKIIIIKKKKKNNLLFKPNDFFKIIEREEVIE